jgi:hypothetical protein
MKIVLALINPPVFFFIGSFYYLMIPGLFYFNDYFELSFLKKVASTYLSDVSTQIYYHVIFDFLIMNLSFFLGYFLFLKIGFKNHFLERYTSYIILPKLILTFLILIVFVVLIKSYFLGYIFFSGYSTYEISILGPLATLCFMSMWFYIYFRRKFFIIIFLVASALLLGAGSRMFFVLPVLSLAIFRIYQYPYRLKKYILGFLVLIFLMLFIGLWRQGSFLSINGLITILFAEPIFTSLGMMFYFESGFPTIGFPTDIIAAIINFVPSSIYPDKQVIMNQITYDEKVFNPLGAQSIIINLYKNFGMLYPLFLFFLGNFFGALFKMRENRFFFTVYVMTLPLIMLHFQREGFITVFKVLFFNGFFLPLLIIIILGQFLSKKR